MAFVTATAGIADASTSTVTVSGSSFTPSSSITVTVDKGLFGTQEWVALFVAADADSAYSYQSNWQYLDGTQVEPGSPVGSYPVNLTFAAPNESGTYNFRFFRENTVAHRLAISSNFTVTASFVPDYYASPTGAGTHAGTVGNEMQISEFWAVAVAGKTLGLQDGVYSDANSNIAPTSGLSGDAGNPIGVRAINEGAVRIDGGNARIPILLVNNSYILVQGVNCHNSSAAVVRISSPSTFNTIKNVVAWDARDENQHVFSCSGTDNLFEDCAGFGVGRKIFSPADGVRTTHRRCWGRWEGSTNVGPKDTFELIYNNSGTVYENCIGTWNNGSMPSTYVLQNNGTAWGGAGAGTYTNADVNQPVGVFAESDGAISDSGSRVFGCIAYVYSGDKFEANAVIAFQEGGGNFQFENVVAYLAGHASQQGIKLLNGASNLSINGATSIATPADTIEAGWNQSSVEHATTVGGVSSIYETGTGAGIRYRYQNGSISGVPLWPWPMNQRIIDATTLANDAGHQHYIYQSDPPVLTLVTDPHAIANVDSEIQAIFGSYP
jgi:hypothetical protein